MTTVPCCGEDLSASQKCGRAATHAFRYNWYYQDELGKKHYYFFLCGDHALDYNWCRNVPMEEALDFLTVQDVMDE